MGQLTVPGLSRGRWGTRIEIISFTWPLLLALCNWPQAVSLPLCSSSMSVERVQGCMTNFHPHNLSFPPNTSCSTDISHLQAKFSNSGYILCPSSLAIISRVLFFLVIDCVCVCVTYLCIRVEGQRRILGALHYPLPALLPKDKVSWWIWQPENPQWSSCLHFPQFCAHKIWFSMKLGIIHLAQWQY